MEHLLSYVAAAFCVAAITFTISVTSIAKPLREVVSKIHEKLDELIHCPWCLSFWFLLIILSTWNVPSMDVFGWPYANFIFTLFSIYTICGLLHFVLLRTYKPIAEMLVDRKLEKLRNNKQN